MHRLNGHQRATDTVKKDTVKDAMKVSPIQALCLALICLSLPACQKLQGQEEQAAEEHHKITVTCPKAKDVTVTQQYVCQIRSQRHINVCAFVNGYLDEIHVREGQS